MKKHTFEINKQHFLLDGKPFKIISGAIHYFRVHPAHWRDRLEKLKGMGCNTVETYVAWNLHQPQKGAFRFDGFCDIEQFIRLAGELGLYCILRPGPYICAEWEFGGLPWWLLAEDDMRVRTRHPAFLACVDTFWNALFPRVCPLQIDQGGPIILMQVENEYGYYGDDTAYLETLRDMMRQKGVAVPLITSDGINGDALACGSVAGALPTANFGSHAQENFTRLEKHLAQQGGGPLMCTEFWVGWFDAWGNTAHQTADKEQNAADLDELLRRGSVNFYMFHGGTNFGFMNGANYYDELTPDVTSYDYDAPLAEDGHITKKYMAFRQVIENHTALPPLAEETLVRKAYGRVEAVEKVSLFATLHALGPSRESPWPLPMEKLGQGYGYTLYRSVVHKGETLEKLRLTQTADRASVFIDGQPALTLYDKQLETEYTLEQPVGKGLQLDILTENMGRVNFSHRMADQRKGIAGQVLVNGHAHTGWTHWPLPMDAAMMEAIDFSAEYQPGLPAFYRFCLRIDTPADTFLDMSGWGKGCVVVNGFNLGRFWNLGPQRRLYLPAPLLKQGLNDIIVFETEGVSSSALVFEAEPKLE